MMAQTKEQALGNTLTRTGGGRNKSSESKEKIFLGEVL